MLLLLLLPWQQEKRSQSTAAAAASPLAVDNRVQLSEKLCVFRLQCLASESRSQVSGLGPGPPRLAFAPAAAASAIGSDSKGISIYTRRRRAANQTALSMPPGGYYESMSVNKSLREKDWPG